MFPLYCFKIGIGGNADHVEIEMFQFSVWSKCNNDTQIDFIYRVYGMIWIMHMDPNGQKHLNKQIAIELMFYSYSVRQ